MKHLDAVTRESLARAWLRDARLEHASVASFARFALQLLGVGAPADLVERAQVAIGDEIRHARLCFSLASRYAERPLGPGELEVQGSLEARSLAEIAADAVLEGCVGETLAALEADARFQLATDPSARAALDVIRSDEAEHAELAWAFVRWAIAQGDRDVRDSVHSAFERARSRVLAASAETFPPVDVVAWHTHGHLTPNERVARERAAFEDVIEPCWRALLEEAVPPRSAVA